jgi:hypothetical protein
VLAGRGRPVEHVALAPTNKGKAALALVEWHSAYFCGKGAPIPIYDRDRLPSNMKLRGPAIIKEIIWQRHRRALLPVSKRPASSIIVEFFGGCFNTQSEPHQLQ